MSTDALRELLRDRVADETTVDLSARAWRRGRAVRRRRSLAVVGGVSAGAVAVTGLVAWIDPTPGAVAHRDTPTFATTSAAAPTSTPTGTGSRPYAEPGPRYQGVDTWWFRDGDRELPHLDGSGLPATIDLSPGREARGAGPVVALLGVVPDGPMSRVTAVSATGESLSLDISRLQAVADEQGNQIAPLVADSLSPDGERAFFVQERSLEVYDVATATWTTIATPPFLAEGARWITPTEIWVPDEIGSTGSGISHDLVTGRRAVSLVRWVGALDWPGGAGFGPVVATSSGQAQAVLLSEGATSPDGTTYGGLEAVHATIRGRASMLVLWGGGLGKRCCPVVGTLDDTLLLESRSEDARVLAWDVGTERVREVSRIVGRTPGEESYVASWRVPLT